MSILRPAPPQSRDVLTDAWSMGPGWSGRLTALNHKVVGRRFLVTAYVFFLIGGIESLLMRWQLGSADSTFLSADVYNAIFTMHGTTMMFLFAVPVGEAWAMYVLPMMLGARDAPYPRLNAFAYYIYLLGGLFLYASFLVGDVPDRGWFAYVPLSNQEYSPGNGMDFWLLGVTFLEISTIAGAIDLITLILKFRAPGMKLSRMPLFAWNTLVAAFAIVFAFPPLVVGSVLLELDRKLGTLFFVPEAGGEPLLWQHLFWFFGHPEVYIMLLPALGIVSSIVAAFTHSRIVAYTLVATSAVAIGVISFGVWVHHMFTTGIPVLAMSFFAAASMLIVVPSAIQISAWIATLWQGRVVWRTPLLYVVGFVVIFVLGGVSGVMVASVPFDQQAHDSYFVIAHFHYVLIGGVVFPVIGAIYYWFPKLSGRLLSERAGRWSFWLAFVGFNLTFFPLHVAGLLGMPRRVYTYEPGLGWEPWQRTSTIGVVVLALGILVTLLAVVSGARRGAPAGGDPWEAHTLEWSISSPPPSYNFRHIPVVTSRAPNWEDRPPGAGTEDGGWRDRLAAPETAVRQVVVTSILDAEPQEITTIPRHSWLPLLAALSLALALLGLMVGAGPIVGVGLLAAVAVFVPWFWNREDQAPVRPSVVLERER